MNVCVETASLKQTVQNQLDSMRVKLQANDCWDFDRNLGRLEGQLQSRYDLTVISSRETNDFSQVKEMWSDLLAFSTFVRDQVHALVRDYSACPHDLSLFDQIQDAISSRCDMLGLNAKR